jgi:hypothetical protein
MSILRFAKIEKFPKATEIFLNVYQREMQMFYPKEDLLKCEF